MFLQYKIGASIKKRGMNAMKKLLSLSLILILLTGCLYPEENRNENQIPLNDQLLAVEQAVVQYRLQNQSLPVRKREEETNIYQQFLIDFHKLVPKYLHQPPGNSFESNGVFQYVLVDVEENPKVKLIDLTITRRIQEFQRTVNDYRRKNRFAPVAELLGNGVFMLDYEKLGLKEPPTVKSPFHPDHRLPLLMDGNGVIIIDYTLDIKYALNKFENSLGEGEDVLSILVEHFPFVPAYSVPYTLQNGKVVFSD